MFQFCKGLGKQDLVHAIFFVRAIHLHCIHLAIQLSLQFEADFPSCAEFKRTLQASEDKARAAKITCTF